MCCQLASLIVLIFLVAIQVVNKQKGISMTQENIEVLCFVALGLVFVVLFISALFMLQSLSGAVRGAAPILIFSAVLGGLGVVGGIVDVRTDRSVTKVLEAHVAQQMPQNCLVIDGRQYCTVDKN